MILPVAVLLLSLAGCVDLQLPTFSPLAGTWYFVTGNPGVRYTGTLDFDYAGHPTAMQIHSADRKEYFVFDGRPYKVGADEYETATASATVTEGRLRALARIEHAGGDRKGVTYVTVEAAVGAGRMSGTLRIAPPREDARVFPFEAERR